MTAWRDHARNGSAWREAGSGPPVVLLHGLGGTRGSWGPQLDALSRSRRCLAWDMPGYGASAPEPSLTFETIADRLVAFLDEVEVDRADMVGLSFGGMHALHTALRFPDRVGRLVLADTSPAFGMDGTDPDQWRAARLAPVNEGLEPADFAADVLDAIVGRPLESSLRADLIEAFGRIPASGFRQAVDCLPANDLRDSLGSIEHEALVIVGELDQETPVAYAAALVDGLVSARLIVLEGVGHLSPSEDPERFNMHVLAFLDQTELPTNGGPT